MPSIDERLHHVTSKVERAKEHIASLASEVDSFLKSEPYGVGTRHDSVTRKLEYFVTRAAAIPVRMSVITGDAIQCLMSALDRLAYQIVCSDTKDAPPKPHKIYFPIDENLVKYNDAKLRKLEGASAASIAAFDALKPYKGGSQQLWELSRLNNIDKHRLLLTVATQAGMDIMRFALASLPATPEWQNARQAMEGMSHFLGVAGSASAFKEGYVLAVGDIDQAPDPKLQFSFTVAINEPDVMPVVPLVATLNAFAKQVGDAIVALKPVLKSNP